MSRPAGNLYHPTNGHPEKTWAGFSWPCFFLGFIWFFVKGMPAWAFGALALGLATFGLSWLVFPFVANDLHRKHLLRQGYMTEDQYEETRASARA